MFGLIDHQRVQVLYFPVVISAIGIYHKLHIAFCPGVAFIIAVVRGVPRAASGAEHQTGQHVSGPERRFLRGGLFAFPLRAGKNTVGLAKNGFINDRLMHAGITLFSEMHFAYIYAVAYGPDNFCTRPSCCVFLLKEPQNIICGSAGYEQLKQLPDLHRLIFVDDQKAVPVVVSCRGIPAAVKVARLAAADPSHCEPLRDLVLFQLGEHGQDTDHRPSEWGRGIKVFVDGDKIRVVRQKRVFDQRKRVLLRAGEPVQFVNDYCRCLAALDRLQHLLERRPVCVAAGVAPVRIDMQKCPALCLAVRFDPLRLLLDRVVVQLVVR